MRLESIREYVDAIHNGIKRMIVNNPGVRILNMLVETITKDILPIQIDCVITPANNENDCKVSLLKILTRQEPLGNSGPTQEDFLITALNARTLIESSGHEIDYLEFFNCSTGMLIKIPWSEELSTQTTNFWNYLRVV